MPSLASIKLDLHLALAIDEFSTPEEQSEPIMEIKRPMELAGLRSRLQRAEATEKAIAVTGKRYDKVLDKIDELHGVSMSNVGQLESYAGALESTIGRMVGGSNGDPNDDGQDGRASDGQVIASDVVTVATPSPAASATPLDAAAATLPEFKIGNVMTPPENKLSG